MKRTIFFDIDGTLTGTISGETFKKHSEDVAVLPGVKEAIAYYKAREWQFIGISNQGGCSAIDRESGKPFKSIDSAIAEMRFTIELIPELSAIYFCPDFEGDLVYKVSTQSTYFSPDVEEDTICKVSIHQKEVWERHQFLDPTTKKPFYQSFRKPGAGMIQKAMNDLEITHASDIWYIGDRPEDEACARNADINFMWADTFRGRFAPGMYDVRNITTKQVEFLENIKL